MYKIFILGMTIFCLNPITGKAQIRTTIPIKEVQPAGKNDYRAKNFKITGNRTSEHPETKIVIDAWLEDPDGKNLQFTYKSNIALNAFRISAKSGGSVGAGGFSKKGGTISLETEQLKIGLRTFYIIEFFLLNDKEKPVWIAKIEPR